MRTLSTAGIAAINGGTVVPVMLVEMDLDGGQMLMNHSRLNLLINGNTYLGTHGLGQVEEIVSAPGEMPKCRFTMSGVPSDKVSLALSEPVQGRAVRVLLALFDNASGAVLDTQPVFIGKLNAMTLQDSPTSAAISVTAESGMRDLLRPCGVMYTHLDQQRLVPGDMAWQFNNAQVEQKIVFPAREWFIKNKG